jgi:hypothetical protein
MGYVQLITHKKKQLCYGVPQNIPKALLSDLRIDDIGIDHLWIASEKLVTYVKKRVIFTAKVISYKKWNNRISFGLLDLENIRGISSSTIDLIISQSKSSRAEMDYDRALSNLHFAQLIAEELAEGKQNTRAIEKVRRERDNIYKCRIDQILEESDSLRLNPFLFFPEERSEERLEKLNEAISIAEKISDEKVCTEKVQYVQQLRDNLLLNIIEKLTEEMKSLGDENQLNEAVSKIIKANKYLKKLTFEENQKNVKNSKFLLQADYIYSKLIDQSLEKADKVKREGKYGNSLDHCKRAYFYTKKLFTDDLRKKHKRDINRMIGILKILKIKSIVQILAEDTRTIPISEVVKQNQEKESLIEKVIEKLISQNYINGRYFENEKYIELD